MGLPQALCPLRNLGALRGRNQFRNSVPCREELLAQSLSGCTGRCGGILQRRPDHGKPVHQRTYTNVPHGPADGTRRSASRIKAVQGVGREAP